MATRCCAGVPASAEMSLFNWSGSTPRRRLAALTLSRSCFPSGCISGMFENFRKIAGPCLSRRANSAASSGFVARNLSRYWRANRGRANRTLRATASNNSSCPSGSTTNGDGWFCAKAERSTVPETMAQTQPKDTNQLVRDGSFDMSSRRVGVNQTSSGSGRANRLILEPAESGEQL